MQIVIHLLSDLRSTTVTVGSGSALACFIQRRWLAFYIGPYAKGARPERITLCDYQPDWHVKKKKEHTLLLFRRHLRHALETLVGSWRLATGTEEPFSAGGSVGIGIAIAIVKPTQIDGELSGATTAIVHST
jgi:hypothetical protein